MAQYTQADLDELDAEIAKVRTVQGMQFADQSITFRPLDELLKLRAVMVQTINSSTGSTRYATTRKGV